MIEQNPDTAKAAARRELFRHEAALRSAKLHLAERMTRRGQILDSLIIRNQSLADLEAAPAVAGYLPAALNTHAERLELALQKTDDSIDLIEAVDVEIAAAEAAVSEQAAALAAAKDAYFDGGPQ